MMRVARVGLVLALIPACATTTGKVAGAVAASSVGAAVGIQASGCSGEGDECELGHNIGSVVLLGVACVAATMALVAESGHHAEAAATPLANVNEPNARSTVVLARDPAIVELAASANIEASLGHCKTVAVLGDRIRLLDAEYYATVFTVQPAIARCR